MSTITVSRPQPSEYAGYYHSYISLVTGEHIGSELEKSAEEQYAFLKNIPEEKGNYTYAEGKWTIKELIQHIIDSERVFAYRALRIARGDEFPLPGYDHDRYVQVCEAHHRSLKDLCEELKHTRISTTYLFKSFSQEMLLKSGITNNHKVSVRALGFCTLGHSLHHLNILKERYL